MLTGSTLVVVADGAVGRFFRRAKSGAPLVEQTDLRMTVKPAEAERDRPPRVQDSFGSGRHAIERRLTAHEIAENKLLAQVAARTVAEIRSEKPECLALCAPPKALGVLRKLLASDLDQQLIVSLDKDITKETSEEIDQRLKEHHA